MNTRAATGRPRRVGPIDIVASRYGVTCQGADELALTLLDVLDYMDRIPVVTHYDVDGKIVDYFPMGEALNVQNRLLNICPDEMRYYLRAQMGRSPRSGPELCYLSGKSSRLQD